jgi:hypothetical protein
MLNCHSTVLTFLAVFGYIWCMQTVYKTGLLLAVLLIGGYAGFSQDSDSITIPDAVLRPSRTDTPRYPRDLVIGDLGQGSLSQDDFNYASNVLRALMQGREQSSFLRTLSEGAGGEFIAEIQAIRAYKFRIGSGKEIVDGAGSFLFRFIGRDGHLGGELYFVRVDGDYALDDIVLEEIPSNVIEGNQNHVSDLFQYERFY